MLLRLLLSAALLVVAVPFRAQAQTEDGSSQPAVESTESAVTSAEDDGALSAEVVEPAPVRVSPAAAGAAGVSRQPVTGLSTDGATAGAPQRMVTINLSGEVDLRVFLDYVSKATGKNFLYDGSVFSGSVIMLAPTQIPEDSLFALLESLLEFKGFALVPGANNLIRVVRTTEAPKKPMPLLLAEDIEQIPDSDKVVTAAYQMKYINVPDVQTAIGPLISGGPGLLIPVTRANIIVITDSVSNLKRIVRVIKWMDDEKNTPKLEIIQCKFTKAETLAGQIARVIRAQETSAGAPAQQQASNFDYDPASNSVIVVGTEPTLLKVRQLVARLDVEPPASTSTRRIYQLKNTKAEEVANTLKQLSEGAPSGVRVMPGVVQPGARQPGAEGQPASAFTVGELRIIGDKNTNSIIVFGPASAQREIEALIAELDKRRPQVLIEALVVQGTAGSNLDIGVELADKGTRGLGATSFGFSEYDFATGTRTIDNEALGLTGAVLHEGDVPLLLRALLVENTGKIISRPKILANDNYKATFKSLDQSPYTTVSSVTSNTSTTTFGGYAEAGTTLTITPHINEEKHLTLDIELVISQFTGAAVRGTENTPGVPPPKREDQLITSVAVPDQSVIVIGGLSGNHKTETTRSVPVLGKIPVLGALFRRKVAVDDNTIEYIFIKAQIASREDFSDLQAMSKEAEDTSREFEETPGVVIPGGKKPGGK